MKYFVAVAVLISITLAACGGDKVPTDIVDQNQVVTRMNATANARKYASEAHPGVDTRVLMQSDSSVNQYCRYGDGWTSGEVIDNATGKTIQKIKCQTNGTGKGINGCMPEAVFKTKDYAAQDGKCDTSLTALEKFK